MDIDGTVNGKRKRDENGNGDEDEHEHRHESDQEELDSGSDKATVNSVESVPN
jgi:hypothetical protein